MWRRMNNIGTIKPCLFCDNTGKFIHALGVFVKKFEDLERTKTSPKDDVGFDLCPGCKGSGYHCVGPALIVEGE